MPVSILRWYARRTAEGSGRRLQRASPRHGVEHVGVRSILEETGEVADAQGAEHEDRAR